MNQTSIRTIIGVMLVLIGGVLVLQNFGFLSGGVLEVVMTTVFAVAGLTFLFVMFQNPKQRWWASFPGFVLLGIGATIGFSELAPPALDFLAGASVLFGICVSFLVVYALKPDFWWALIPGFVFGGLTALVVLEEANFVLLRGDIPAAIFLAGVAFAFLAVYIARRDFWWAIIPFGAIMGVALLVAFGNVSYLFFGLAGTFVLLALMKIDGAHMSWPWIPALILGVIGSVFFVTEAIAALTAMNFIIPVALIAVGGFLLFRGIFRR